MRRNNDVPRNPRRQATSVAALLFLCSNLVKNPSVVSAFTAVPSTIASVHTRPASLPISGLQISISAGSTQVTDNNNDSSSQSSTTTQKDTTSSAESQVNWDWKAVMQEIWKLDPRPIIMFDGDCNLCNGGVNMLLDMDTNNEFRFCSLSSNFGKTLLVAHGKQPDDRDNIMVVFPVNPDAQRVQSNYLQKSEAVMRIASKLEGAPQWVKAMSTVGTVAPAQVSDWFLQLVADNRHNVNIGEEYQQCRLDFDGEYEGRFLNDYEHPQLFEPYDEEKLREQYSDIMFS